MSDSSIERGHKRPLSPPTSRANVLQASKDQNEWTKLDEDLMICESNKRQKSNHQDSPSLNLGSSLLRTPAKEALARAATSCATANEIDSLSNESSPSKNTSAIIPWYIPRSVHPFGKYTSNPEDETRTTGEQNDGNTNQSDTHEEDADREAARLAQLTNPLLEDAEMAGCIITSTPKSDSIKELKAQREREGLERSRMNRALNLDAWNNTMTSNNSSSSMTFTSSKQSNLTYRQVRNPLQTSLGPLRNIETLPSFISPTDEAENERLLDYAQSHLRGESENEDSARTNGERNTASGVSMQHTTPDTRPTFATNNRSQEEKSIENEAGRQRLQELMEMEKQSLQEIAPMAQIITRPLQSRSSDMHQQNMNSFQDIASIANNWKPLVTKLPSPSTQTLEVTQSTLYPPQGENVDMPKGFERKTKEMQAIIRQHEIFKLRGRNLDAIPEVMKWIATAGSAKPFSTTEHQELREANVYLSKVLNEDLCGSRRRTRINQIRDNMKRRAGNLPPPNQEVVERFYHSIFPPRLQDKLALEKSELDEQSQVLGDLRRTSKQVRKRTSLSQNASSTKSEANLTDDVTLDLSEPEAPPIVRSKPLTKKQVNRPFQVASIEEKQARLRLQLEAFDKQGEGGANGSDNTILESFRGDDEDAMSDISEEEEGADYYHGTRIVGEGTTNGTSNLEHSQVQEGGNHRAEANQSVSSSQQPHEGLRNELEAKQIVQKHRAQQHAQRPDVGLVNRAREKAAFEHSTANNDKAEVVALCDDSDVSESEQSNDEDRICYRYHVYICATGIDGFDDATKYLQNTFLKLDKANDKADLLVKEIMVHHMPDTDSATDESWEESKKRRDGMNEYNVALGRDQEVVARVWVEQEEFSVSDQAFKDARFKRACQPKPIYLVMWERTVRRWAEEPEVQEDDVATVDTEETMVEKVVTVSDRPAQEEKAKEASTIKNITSSDTVATSDPQDESIVMGEADDDDLFGPLSPEPVDDDDAMEVSSEVNSDNQHSPNPDESAASDVENNIVSVERPSPTDIVITTSIALANRIAKDRFLVWLTGHVRGRENHAYIRHEERIMEEELERCGNKTTWSKVEDFDGDFEDGTKGSEELKVWVQEKKVIGPAN